MDQSEFEEATKFNLSDLIDYSSNAILVKDIVVKNTCVVQLLVFDFGKVQVYKKSPFSRFIHIIEGKAELVINNNSTFMKNGDSILIPGTVNCSIEANQPFKMICATIKND